MDDTCIRIDIDKLSRRLSQLHGKNYSKSESVEWLEAQSLRREGQHWYCDGHTVGALQSDEILEMMHHETEGGMMYISHAMRMRE